MQRRVGEVRSGVPSFDSSYARNSHEMPATGEGAARRLCTDFSKGRQQLAPLQSEARQDTLRDVWRIALCHGILQLNPSSAGLGQKWRKP